MTWLRLDAILFDCPVNERLLTAMTLTDDEMSAASAEFTGGAGARRRPITDVGTWLDRLNAEPRATLRALGELLLGVADHATSESAEQFTARCLGVADCGHLLVEERALSPVARVTVALALAEWMDQHRQAITVGPGEYADPPKWSQTEIGGQCYRHPLCLRVCFPAGTLLAGVGCVIAIEVRESVMRAAEVSVFVTPDRQVNARSVLDRLAERANALNPYRGRAVRATDIGGLHLSVIDLPVSMTRETVVVSRDVWAEVDIGVAAVRDRHDMLNSHGLGTRRGVLLCGPPGTGKSAVSAVVANEVVGDFTVIYVEAKAGARLLTAVVEEAQRLGGPVLLILEDIDLWCQRRTVNGSGLSELLQAMDIRSEARILTLASTNDASTLDGAAIRTGRFDSIVEVDYPGRADAARILAALLRGIPGGTSVHTATVAAALPENTSGSDLREIVRRAVLAADGTALSTSALLAEVGAGRYRVELPTGHYL